MCMHVWALQTCHFNTYHSFITTMWTLFRHINIYLHDLILLFQHLSCCFCYQLIEDPMPSIASILWDVALALCQQLLEHGVLGARAVPLDAGIISMTRTAIFLRPFKTRRSGVITTDYRCQTVFMKYIMYVEYDVTLVRVILYDVIY